MVLHRRRNMTPGQAGCSCLGTSDYDHTNCVRLTMEHKSLCGQHEPVWLSLLITGFASSPEDTTDAVGVQPSKTWLQGESVSPNAWIRHPSNGWQLRVTDSPQSLVLDDFVGRLMEVIQPNVDRFRNLPHDASIKVFCTILDRRIVLKVLPDRLIRLGAIGAALEIDYQASTPIEADAESP